MPILLHTRYTRAHGRQPGGRALPLAAGRLRPAPCRTAQKKLRPVTLLCTAAITQERAFRQNNLHKISCSSNCQSKSPHGHNRGLRKLLGSKLWTHSAAVVLSSTPGQLGGLSPPQHLPPLCIHHSETISICQLFWQCRIFPVPSLHKETRGTASPLMAKPSIITLLGKLQHWQNPICNWDLVGFYAVPIKWNTAYVHNFDRP